MPVLTIVENTLAGEFITAARRRVGRPFKNHYEPADICNNGAQTADECMQRGMDWRGGYDCSGLVIACMCEVLGIATETWPRDRRHLIQLETVAAVDIPAHAGDLVIMYAGTLKQAAAHIGIAALDRHIHASSKIGLVTEGRVGGINSTRVIPLAAFAAIPVAGSQLANNR